MKASRFFGFLLLSTLLFSCSVKKPIYIASEIREINFISSLYQSEYPDTDIIIRIIPSISKAMIESGKYDLIIGRSLENSTSKSLFSDLNEISKNPLPDELFRNWYLTTTGKQGNRLPLVPLGYDLPVIIYKKNSEMETEKIVSFDIFREYSSSYNVARSNREEWLQMGFSPGWNPEIFIWEMLCRNIQLEENGHFKMNDSDIIEIAENAVNWELQVSQSREMEKAFSEKYRYIPDFKLLEQGQIGYLPMHYSEFLTLDDNLRNSLDFFFPGTTSVPIISVFSGGIPESSKNKEEACLFLNWLLEEKNQASIVTHFQERKINSFGFLGGFSTLDSLNRSELVKYYPELKSMLPTVQQLTYPSALPERWEGIKNKVLIPWFSGVLYDGFSLNELNDLYTSWDLLDYQEEEY